MPTDWKKEFVQDLVKKNQPQPKKIPAKKKNNNFPFGLVLLFILVSSMLVGAYAWKRPLMPLSSFKFPEIVFKFPERSEAPVIPQPILPPPRPEPMQPQLDLNLIGEIQKRGHLNNEKIMILGGVFNHNMYVLRNNLSKDNIIYINHDFTINRIPDKIILNQEDRDFFNKYVR